jgi:hypothetical protein
MDRQDNSSQVLVGGFQLVHAPIDVGISMVLARVGIDEQG